MAKTKISEYDAISANNTDVDSINIAEGCAPSGINNAIREVMAHLKDFQTGVSGDSLTVGGNLSVTGTVTIPDNAISGDKVEGGTINAITINTLTAGQANFGDNDKAIFGAGSDLQIYHDGTNSYIDDAGVGDLNIRANNLYLQKYTGETYINAVADGAVGIYHDGAKKFSTTSTGIDVTGTVVSDGLTVGGVIESVGSTSIVYLMETDAVDKNTYLRNGDGGTFTIRTVNDAKTISTTRFGLDHATGDISFYEDTGTTAKFFWDASAEALGIGGTPVEKLYVNSTSGDSRIGLNAPTGSDTEIKFSNNAVVEYTIGHDDGTNNFVIGTDNVDTALVSITKTGNLGLGVTPSAWAASAIDVGSWASFAQRNTNGWTLVGGNVYWDGANYKYKNSSTAALYELRGPTGSHAWHTAPSGTAGGTITFNQAMTLDASGRLGVGETSPATKLHIKDTTVGGTPLRIQGANNYTYDFRSLSDGTTDGRRLDINIGSSAGQISFSNSARTFATFDSSGNLLVGATNQPIGTAKFVSSASGTVYGGTFVTDTAGATPLIAWNKAASGTIYLVEFATGASYLAKGSITSNGTSTSYNTTSDYRLKEDWQPMTGASERVKALKPVNFAWKADGSRVDGFLAHEAQAVVPECVTGEKDAVDAEGKPVYQGIDQSKLVPLLTAALQEALAKIESLEARLDAANL